MRTYALSIENVGKMFRILFRNKYERSKLRNKDFTILCNTCIGGVMSHDLGQRFLSPTVNLYISPHHFVNMIENLEYYFSLRLEPDQKLSECLNYPVGRLGDILIYFKHYQSFEEAKNKWEERKRRVNYDNLYIMMTDRWCCPKEDLIRFEKLPYKKVCFTAKPHKDCPSSRVVKKNNEGTCVGIITSVVNVFGKRLYQCACDFNYIEFLNDKD